MQTAVAPTDFLNQVTPLLITLDEEPNLPRTLAALSWARRIVVVDSGSSDGTLDLLRSQSNVVVLSREFDAFAAQCEHGLRNAVETEWVLSLDADHVVTPALVEELRTLAPAPEVHGYRIGFAYCIRGKPLRGSLYPPRSLLFRKDYGRHVDDGHGHHVDVRGRVEALRSHLLHDDRKPFSRWLQAQRSYAAAEASKLLATRNGDLSLADRVRKIPYLAPPLVFFYCLVVKRGILDGYRGLLYAGQRALAELILSIQLLNARIEKD